MCSLVESWYSFRECLRAYLGLTLKYLTTFFGCPCSNPHYSYCTVPHVVHNYII